MTRKSLITFLVFNSKLKVSKTNYVIQDFIEDKHEKGRFFNFDELKELRNIVLNGNDLTNSFMYEEIKPYVLPFLDRKNSKTGSFLKKARVY